ncbi:MAG: Uma2 family endonuclease [Hyphomicrobiaceae bacterium]
MNEIVKAPARRKWTLAELDRLGHLGFFGEHEHVELIGGELFAMPPKGIRHEIVRGEIADKFNERRPARMRLRVELGWRPSGDVYLEPDILVAAAQRNLPLVPPDDVALLVEIAMSSLQYDHGLKAETYAALGVAEYWVVNAVTLETRVHRDPAPHGYRAVTSHAASETIVPARVPELAICLADLDIGSDGLDGNET